MRVIIIEDELPVDKRLIKMVQAISDELDVLIYVSGKCPISRKR